MAKQLWRYGALADSFPLFHWSIKGYSTFQRECITSDRTYDCPMFLQVPFTKLPPFYQNAKYFLPISYTITTPKTSEYSDRGDDRPSIVALIKFPSPLCTPLHWCAHYNAWSDADERACIIKNSYRAGGMLFACERRARRPRRRWHKGRDDTG